MVYAHRLMHHLDTKAMSKPLKMYRLYEYNTHDVLQRIIGHPAPYAIHCAHKKQLEAKNKLMHYIIQQHVTR